MLSVVTISSNQDLERLPVLLDSIPPALEVVIVETIEGTYVKAEPPKKIYFADRWVTYSLYQYAKGHFSFSNVRNYANTLVSEETTWILSLDADEKLLGDPSAIVNLPDTVGGVYMLNASFSPFSNTWSTSAMLRAFRKHSKIGWQFAVHEQVLPSIIKAGFDTVHSDIIIQHSGYLTKEQIVNKLTRNKWLLYRDLATMPSNEYLEKKLYDTLNYLREHYADNN